MLKRLSAALVAAILAATLAGCASSHAGKWYSVDNLGQVQVIELKPDGKVVWFGDSTKGYTWRDDGENAVEITYDAGRTFRVTFTSDGRMLQGNVTWWRSEGDAIDAARRR